MRWLGLAATHAGWECALAHDRMQARRTMDKCWLSGIRWECVTTGSAEMLASSASDAVEVAASSFTTWPPFRMTTGDECCSSIAGTGWLPACTAERRSGTAAPRVTHAAEIPGAGRCHKTCALGVVRFSGWMN